MPRARPVESHAPCYIAENREPPRHKAVASDRYVEVAYVATIMKLHGTSPWYLSHSPCRRHKARGIRSDTLFVLAPLREKSLTMSQR